VVIVDALDILHVQLTRDLFAIAKFKNKQFIKFLLKQQAEFSQNISV